MAKRKRKATAAAPRRRRRRKATTRRNPGLLANPRRRRRATARRRSVAAPSRRRRRSVRRNPSFGGAVNLVTRGVKDAAYMVGGEMASNIIAGYIPALLKTPEGTETNTGVQLRKVISAAIVGFAAQTVFRGGEAARLMVAGALASSIKSFVRPMLPQTGVLAGALSSYPRPSLALASYPSPALLPRPALAGYGGVGRSRNGLGCDDNGGGYGAAVGFGS